MNDFSHAPGANPVGQRPAGQQPGSPAGNGPQLGPQFAPQPGQQPNAAYAPGGPRLSGPMGGAPAPYTPAPQLAPYAPKPAKKGPNGFAIAGLVVSLLATFVVLERFNQFVSPFGVIGLILSILGYMVNADDEGEGRSRTARIFAIIGGVLSIITIVVTLLVGLIDPNFSSSYWF